MRSTQTCNKETSDYIRVDKFLKVSRIIKRRSVAKDFCDAARVWINDRDAKASSRIKIGDRVKVKFGNNMITIKIVSVNTKARKDEAKEMYEIIEEKVVEE